MEKVNNQISATEFKKHFLSLVDDVRNNHSSFVITKRKLPIAKIVPLDSNKVDTNKNYFGCMKGTVKIKGDIINCNLEHDWEVINDQ
ncbi:type II toxin-antitoxin system Phd/YefM family antitoxin [Candidatus Tisiphia endosymbiont of Ptychoptera albimana]|uniref:type II toxin-antitoxin system Phd/YefM family antitoxin n=1 Tax=Candidatus Tisiphia endosymbiont of Ptychoptera albimana TaxID=3066260 RepID=UPI001DCC2347|nr:type II toxin-antitoxin system Phd/YefM family antitoxin [Rickettsia endosymbiont of Sericostoma sp. HW-2014]